MDDINKYITRGEGYCTALMCFQRIDLWKLEWDVIIGNKSTSPER